MTKIFEHSFLMRNYIEKICHRCLRTGDRPPTPIPHPQISRQNKKQKMGGGIQFHKHTHIYKLKQNFRWEWSWKWYVILLLKQVNMSSSTFKTNIFKFEYETTPPQKYSGFFFGKGGGWQNIKWYRNSYYMEVIWIWTALFRNMSKSGSIYRDFFVQ